MNMNGVLLGSEKPKELAAFYTKMFGEPAWKDEDNGWTGFMIGQGFLGMGPHSEVKGKSESPGRVMIQIETKDVKGEFEKFKDRGAEVVAEPYQPTMAGDGLWLATLADPDGNYFQLASPWEPPADGKK